MDDFDFREHYKIGDIIYYLRVMPDLGVNEVLTGKIRTIYPDSIVASREDNSKQAIYIDSKAKNFIFKDKKLALKESKKIYS